MYNAIPDLIRQLSIEDLFRSPAFKNCRLTWPQQIQELLVDNFNESQLTNLADHLSDIFLSTREDGRGRSAFAADGAG